MKPYSEHITSVDTLYLTATRGTKEFYPVDNIISIF